MCQHHSNLFWICFYISISCCCSVAKSHPTLCDPLGCSTLGFPILHYLPEFAQTHLHWVHDAIQSSCPLLAPSPHALNLSQHQGFFQWVSSLYQVAKVLDLQLQYNCFQWIFRTDFLHDWLVWSPRVQGTLKSLIQHHSSKTSILQCSAFFMVQLSHLVQDSWKNHSFDYMDLCWQSGMSAF